MIKLLLSVLFYGHVGLLIEIWFTSLHSVFADRDYRAPGRTYLWMIPTYGIGAMVLDYIRRVATDPVQFCFFAVLAIFGIEFTSGWLLRKIVGKCPWDYGQAQYGIMGLIRLDYAHYWLLAAIGFYYFSGQISSLINRVADIL